jgi:hypothetical protein
MLGLRDAQQTAAAAAAVDDGDVGGSYTAWSGLQGWVRMLGLQGTQQTAAAGDDCKG